MNAKMFPQRSSIDVGFGVGVRDDLKESGGQGRVFPERRPKWWVPEYFGTSWQIKVNRGQMIQGLTEMFKFLVLILAIMGCHRIVYTGELHPRRVTIDILKNYLCKTFIIFK